MPHMFAIALSSARSARCACFASALAMVLLSGPAHSQATRPAPKADEREDASFAATIARLSEPGGYFDTDNLISNETSYLHVLGALRRRGVSGGAYVGVGPDQNYSYIAAIRPRVAYILDVRRDNMLQHLMFRALFERSRNRMEYLTRLLARPVPPDIDRWGDRSIEDILAYLDGTRSTTALAAAQREDLIVTVRKYGVPLAPNDIETLTRFHTTFVREGLELRFTSFNRAPRPYYPTLRQLIRERDLAGRQAGYLAREADFRFVKDLHAAGRLIPVVGDFAGTKALPGIAREIASRGEKLSAVYLSNVEFYLWRDGGFGAFAANVARLPRDGNSVIIRSYFGGGYGARHPMAQEGHSSVQLYQSVDDFTRRLNGGGWKSYWELVTVGAGKLN